MEHLLRRSFYLIDFSMKVFKIAGYGLLLAMVPFIQSCSNGEEKNKGVSNLTLFQEAKAQSQEIINDIGTDRFMIHFRNNPNFPDSTKPIYVHSKLNECKVESAKLKYFDHFKEILRDTAEIDVIDFFYQGPCACPDIRIMLTFFLYKEQKKIEFTRFKAEPAAKPSDWMDAIRERNAKQLK